MLYRAVLTEQIAPEGLYIYYASGKPVTLEGRELVDTGEALVPRGPDWQEDRIAAGQAVADRVQAMANRLLEQAARLRGGDHGIA